MSQNKNLTLLEHWAVVTNDVFTCRPVTSAVCELKFSSQQNF